MTKREAAIVMAYTGIAMFQGDDLQIFYKYVEEILGISPIYTHEIPSKMEEIQNKSKSDFIALCQNLKNDETEVNFYDCEEIHDNCTVQVLSNSMTGDISIGWWENK